MNEFLEGVYAQAGPIIRKYIDLLHDKVEKENLHMHIWIGPNVPFLTDAVVAQADQLWQEAEKAVAGQPEVLERVRFARLSVDFAIVERARIKSGGKAATTDPAVKAAAERFFTVGKRAGIRTIREHNTTLEEYRKSLNSLLGPVKQAV